MRTCYSQRNVRSTRHQTPLNVSKWIYQSPPVKNWSETTERFALSTIRTIAWYTTVSVKDQSFTGGIANRRKLAALESDFISTDMLTKTMGTLKLHRVINACFWEIRLVSKEVLQFLWRHVAQKVNSRCSGWSRRIRFGTEWGKWSIVCRLRKTRWLEWESVDRWFSVDIEMVIDHLNFQKTTFLSE